MVLLTGLMVLTWEIVRGVTVVLTCATTEAEIRTNASNSIVWGCHEVCFIKENLKCVINFYLIMQLMVAIGVNVCIFQRVSNTQRMP